MIVVDAGPLKAAVDRDDEFHEWAVRAFTGPRARFVTCEAAITEALYKGTKRNIESEDDPKNAEVG